MSCCAAKGCEEFFTENTARRDAQRYRKKGLTGPARRMVELLRGSLAGATVLEVGGGVGALHLELLKAGAERALNLELSPAYDAYARELAADAGVAPRVERRVLDFAERAGEIEAADVVVLNKVVCCYPDYAKLVSAAADRTRRYLLMSFPRVRAPADRDRRRSASGGPSARCLRARAGMAARLVRAAVTGVASTVL